MIKLKNNLRAVLLTILLNNQRFSNIHTLTPEICPETPLDFNIESYIIFSSFSAEPHTQESLVRGPSNHTGLSKSRHLLKNSQGNPYVEKLKKWSDIGRKRKERMEHNEVLSRQMKMKVYTDPATGENYVFSGIRPVKLFDEDSYEYSVVKGYVDLLKKSGKKMSVRRPLFYRWAGAIGKLVKSGFTHKEISIVLSKIISDDYLFSVYYDLEKLLEHRKGVMVFQKILQMRMFKDYKIYDFRNKKAVVRDEFKIKMSELSISEKTKWGAFSESDLLTEDFFIFLYELSEKNKADLKGIVSYRGYKKYMEELWKKQNID